jgi:hypothetical protein
MLYSSSMTPKEQEILDALLALERAIESMPHAQPKPNLLPLFARLDELTAALPPSTDPSLLHYLHKKSFQKARLFLQGREAENQSGNCRHVDTRGRPWEPPAHVEPSKIPPAR